MTSKRERESYADTDAAVVASTAAWKFICEEEEILHEEDPDETQFADLELARWIFPSKEAARRLTVLMFRDLCQPDDHWYKHWHKRLDAVRRYERKYGDEAASEWLEHGWCRASVSAIRTAWDRVSKVHRSESFEDWEAALNFLHDQRDAERGGTAVNWVRVADLGVGIPPRVCDANLREVRLYPDVASGKKQKS